MLYAPLYLLEYVKRYNRRISIRIDFSVYFVFAYVLLVMQDYINRIGQKLLAVVRYAALFYNINNIFRHRAVGVHVKHFENDRRLRLVYYDFLIYHLITERNSTACE